MTDSRFRLAEVGADDSGRLDAVRMLFREYADSLGEDLCFQGFERELAELPGKYSPPCGGLFLACKAEAPVGCVAIRQIPYPELGNASELKRLYVRPDCRGGGLGRQLALLALDRARAGGSEAVYLDTLSWLTAALNMYRSLGFEVIEPYYGNPIQNVVYMRLSLGPAT